MVDYLCRERLVVPTTPSQPKRGRRRKYTFGDLVILRAVAKLLQKGVSVSRLKASLHALRGRHPEITRDGLPASFLVTDGKTILFRESHEIVEELNSGQLVFAFVMELDGVRQEILRLLGNVSPAPRRPGLRIRPERSKPAEVKPKRRSR